MARRAIEVTLLALLLGTVPAGAETRPACQHHDPQRRPWFGDLHVHTTYSLDASTQGTRNTPRDAYRFARGETLGIQPYGTGDEPLRRGRLERPLDFAAVTDHAELFGETEICRTPGLPGHDSIPCRIYRGWPRLAFFLINSRGSPRFRFCGHGAVHCREAAARPWHEIRTAAEAATDRSPACRFTSFVGYEWTAAGAGASNLHRNVIFRSEAVPERPPDAIDFPTPEALWDELDRSCVAAEGCAAVVIPHNSNISGGLMFETRTADGEPLTPRSAARRRASERLVEIMQHKGASECRRSTATADELCGFEELPYDRFMGHYFELARREPGRANFVRHVLAEGLVQQVRLGVNPFELGIIASTDTHLATPGWVDEDATYPGHGGAGEPAREGELGGLPDSIHFNPGGLAVLWAEENSRDSLFAALERREVYGTSGPRIVLRLFAGWDLPEDLCARTDFVAGGYAGGVPMGGVLESRSPEGAPTLALSALQDPGTEGRPGTPLQRLQIVKAWVQDGAARELVVDVAGDAGNGARVDPETCEAHGPGFPGLCAVWTDPDFDPKTPALYYARAVENPTCRWSAALCNARNVDCSDAGLDPKLAPCCDPSIPKTVQERAWSSPVWVRPAPD